MGKNGEYASRLKNIRTRIDELSSGVEAGDAAAMRRSAHLARAAGDISARMGQYEDAGTYYHYGAKVLGMTTGDAYEETRNERDLLNIDSAKMFKEHEKQRAERRKKGVLEEYASAGTTSASSGGSGRYERHDMALIIALFAGSLALMTLTATGRVIGYAAQKSSGMLGICLFAICIVASYMLLIRKKD